MTRYRCECGKEEREVTKAKIVLREGKWVADVICSCNKYMDSEPTEGMPSLKRTEPTLSNKDDMLWDKAKEQL
jgi:hypothetical protein